MDQIGEPSQSENLKGLNFLIGLKNLTGIVLVILMITWLSYFRGGFAWSSNSGSQFNWHPLLMVLGLVFLYSNAMLIYRFQRHMRKRYLKLVHAGIMLCVVLFVVIGLVAVFEFHNKMNIPNMYSLHSWVGLTVVILFCCQWVAGCAMFLFPNVQLHLRTAYMPVHVYFGIAVFIGSVASCMLGLIEKAIFAVGDYNKFPPEGIMINVIGLILVVFGGLSVYIVSQSRYKRLPRPEDDVLLTGRND